VSAMTGLTYIREIFNMSMNDLAEKLGVTKQTISKWESGKVQVSDERLSQLEHIFKLSAAFFLKKEFTDADIIEIEQARFLYKIRKHTTEEYSMEFIDKYWGAVFKPQELMYLLENIKDIFESLDSDHFIELSEVLVNVINLVETDTDYIYKISELVDLVYEEPDDVPSELPTLEEMTKQDLIKRHIRNLIRDLNKLNGHEEYN